MIGKIAMLFIGIYMGISLMSILKAASDSNDQIEEERRQQEDEKE